MPRWTSNRLTNLLILIGKKWLQRGADVSARDKMFAHNGVNN